MTLSVLEGRFPVQARALSQRRSAVVPKCPRSSDEMSWAELSGHFGTGAEVSWYRSVLGPKCPVTTRSADGDTF